MRFSATGRRALGTPSKRSASKPSASRASTRGSRGALARVDQHVPAVGEARFGGLEEGRKVPVGGGVEHRHVDVAGGLLEAARGGRGHHFHGLKEMRSPRPWAKSASQPALRARRGRPMLRRTTLEKSRVSSKDSVIGGYSKRSRRLEERDLPTACSTAWSEVKRTREAHALLFGVDERLRHVARPAPVALAELDARLGWARLPPPSRRCASPRSSRSAPGCRR